MRERRWLRAGTSRGPSCWGRDARWGDWSWQLVCMPVGSLGRIDSVVPSRPPPSSLTLAFFRTCWISNVSAAGLRHRRGPRKGSSWSNACAQRKRAVHEPQGFNHRERRDTEIRLKARWQEGGVSTQRREEDKEKNARSLRAK
jgi:hypothetical protein